MASGSFAVAEPNEDDAYFLARRFGSAALQASGDLDSLRAAVEDSTRQDRYFWGAPLSTGVEQPGG